MEKFPQIIAAADALRPGYAASIGFDKAGALEAADLPQQLSNIFRFAKGTPHEIAEQQWMDLVPGYRLMLATEIPEARTNLRTFYGADQMFNVTARTPFLTNYSSDYYLTADDDSGIFWLDHTGGVSKVSPNLETFLDTVFECYVEGAYRTNEIGFLDMDDDLELKIGLAQNPNCDYWDE